MSDVTFGSYISAERKKKSISQKELAARVLREEDDKPISPQYLNDIERDRRQPTSDHLIHQFAAVLDVPVDYLFYLAGTLPKEAKEARLDPSEAVKAMSAFRRG
ncbi:XRE family transcriptional regulator [Aureimonas sp. Leaf454]|uniref:helix-turn-helix domain-containing protein n=1 Tax=Aureimonas sp. Leaf454 TaxID=1736381 RepID=UPI0006F44D32|nr:helix-turn-helix transcriptional regulator [Aureimonas sp. Leaf454]KQT48999.1 XRE family transcriptional regulator [Aureimonas sp. Leaf454]